MKEVFNIKTKEEAKEYISENINKIRLYFSTSLGFPGDVFKDKFESINLAEQLAFVIKFKT